jgi:hypothetical protein
VFNKQTSYKVNIQESIVLQYISNHQLELLSLCIHSQSCRKKFTNLDKLILKFMWKGRGNTVSMDESSLCLFTERNEYHKFQYYSILEIQNRTRKLKLANQGPHIQKPKRKANLNS